MITFTINDDDKRLADLLKAQHAPATDARMAELRRAILARTPVRESRPARLRPWLRAGLWATGLVVGTTALALVLFREEPAAPPAAETPIMVSKGDAKTAAYLKVLDNPDHALFGWEDWARVESNPLLTDEEEWL